MKFPVKSCCVLKSANLVLLRAGLVAAFVALLASIRHGVTWIAWLLPAPAAWDLIHERSSSDGGVWKYGAVVHPEITCFIESQIRNYTSLLDVSCNAGIMLAQLQHPNKKLYGTDISQRILREAHERCPSCELAAFDLSRLQNEALPDGLLGTDTFDVVVVSDVLYYLQWSWWPPVLVNWELVPAAFVRAAQRRFFARLTALARVAVVFSGHQKNAAVVSFLEAMGVQRLRQFGGVWVAPGSAGGSGVGPSWLEAHGPRFESCVRASRPSQGRTAEF